MKIKGIIFDLDGTLLYTLEDLHKSVNFSLKKLNLPEISLEDTRNYVGNGVYRLIERAVGKNKDCVEECYEIFKKHYSINSKNNTKSYPDALKYLKLFKEHGIKLAVLSNKLNSAVNDLVEYYFKDIFDISLGESADFPKKPDSKACEYIIRKFNLKNKEIIFVGDSEVDLQTAKNAGIECISVSWGYKDREFLIKNGAKNIVDSFEELAAWMFDSLEDV